MKTVVKRAWRTGSACVGGAILALYLLCFSPALAEDTGGKILIVGSAEGGKAQDAALSEAIDRAGSACDLIDAPAILDATLDKYSLAIVSGSAKLNPATGRMLERFASRGGKILAFGTLSEETGRVLCVKSDRAIPADKAVAFKTLKLTGDLRGFPIESALAPVGLYEASISEPAIVVGNWVAADGRTLTALVKSPNGIYVSSDAATLCRAGCERFLRALVCALAKDGWENASARLLERTRIIGGMTHIVQLQARIESPSLPDSRCARAGEILSKIRDLENDFNRKRLCKEFPQAIDVLPTMRERIEELYALGFPTRPFEVRGAWLHDPTVRDWDAAMLKLRSAGLNALCCNVSSPAYADYPSKVLPVSARAQKNGDMVRPMIDAARRHGVAIHLWMVNYWLRMLTPENKEKLLKEGRLCMTGDGALDPFTAICPTHEANVKLLEDAMVEMAVVYRPASVQYDYIRYMGPHFCFCPRCKEKFQKDTGITVQTWPKQATPMWRYSAKWNEWRREQITASVKRITEAVHAAAPDVAVSADVFPEPMTAGWGVAQDWPKWAEKGYVDLLFPMNYTISNEFMATIASGYRTTVRGRVPLYMGLGLWEFKRPEQPAEQIDLARRAGADGFCLFEFHSITPRMAELMRLGVTEADAAPDHFAPAIEVELPAGRGGKYGVLEAGKNVRIAVRLKGRLPADRPLPKMAADVVLIRPADDSDAVAIGRLEGEGELEGRFETALPDGEWRIAAWGRLPGKDGSRRSFISRGPLVSVVEESDSQAVRDNAPHGNTPLP
ncbi:MAG TPA: family 10 glycosylhydrolase [Candidatus Brocadiia bacterium]|nr:family 10 glycosylhydrolase [Candidatus Brocadiia bacterium]